MPSYPHPPPKNSHQCGGTGFVNTSVQAADGVGVVQEGAEGGGGAVP